MNSKKATTTKNRTEIFIFIVCILLSIFLCVGVLAAWLTDWLVERVVCAFVRSFVYSVLLLFFFITSFHSLIIIVYRYERCSEAYVIRF